MKIIPKLQKGGPASFFEVWAPRNPAAPKAVAAKESKSKDKEDSGELTKKDLFEMITDVNGLPNEMSAIVTDLMNTFNMAKLTGEPIDIEYEYLKNLYDIRVAAQNKTRFDEVIKQATTDGILHEAAIASNGNLVILNQDGSIGTVEVSKYLENPKDYNVMSNSNIAYMRRTSPAFINNSAAFDILTNGMSYKLFQELVDKASKSLGTSEVVYNGTLDASNAKQAEAGLQVLKSLSGNNAIKHLADLNPSTLYKYNIINKDQLEQIKAFLTYISKSMPENAKSWAALKTGIKDSNKAVEALVGQYLASAHTITRSLEITPDDSSNKGSGNSGDSDGKLKLNNPARWLAGYGDKEIFVINPGSTYSSRVLSNSLPLTDAEHKNLGPMCSLQEVGNGEFGGILNWNKATMGGKKIRPEALNQILVEDGRIYSIDYPINANGDPDYTPATKSKYDAAIQALSNMGIDLNDPNSVRSNYETINKTMRDHALPTMFDKNGNLVTRNWRRFAVMNGTAFDRTLGVETGEYGGALLQEVEDDIIIDDVVSALQNKMSEGEGDKYKVDRNDAWIFEGSYDILYKGTIWIPVRTDVLSALSKELINPSDAYQVEYKQEFNNILQNYQKPPEL